ncbi:30S ribosomal protein S11 [Candidatus Peregrinibacteria bacterium]|nr:30S ribosomal protein S11 [Candidatus Peregrinibacteria bacterium]
MAEQDKKITVKAKTADDKKETTNAAAEVAGDEKVVKVKKSKSKRTVTEGNAYVQSTFNNTLVTITDMNGSVIAWSSAGTNGFKGAKKATPYAAQVSAEAAVNKALLYGIEKLHVYVKGLGSGREQAIRGLHSSGINIETITDVTPVPHNGCRPRKSRRV